MSVDSILFLTLQIHSLKEFHLKSS